MYYREISRIIESAGACPAVCRMSKYAVWGSLSKEEGRNYSSPFQGEAGPAQSEAHLPWASPEHVEGRNIGCT